jgi:hypothetical protein
MEVDMSHAPRLSLVLAGALSLALGSGGTVSAAFGPPVLVRQADVLRLRDLANNGPVVAIGWQEGAKPGQLWVRLSRDGGATFRPKYAVAGLGGAGMSLAVCNGQVWAVTAARYPGDSEADSDLMISRRAVAGRDAAQAFLTSPSGDHKVRDPDIACIGDRLLAIAWLQRSGNRTRAYLLVRDQAGLLPSSVNRLRDLGAADPQGGIAVAVSRDASGRDAVLVAWARRAQQDLRLKRLLVGRGAAARVTPTPTVTQASGQALRPKLAGRGRKAAITWTQEGRLMAALSNDGGATFTTPATLVRAGRPRDPATATSIDLRSRRVVIEVLRPPPRSSGESGRVPARIETRNWGGSWRQQLMGNRGARQGVLRPMKGGGSRLLEAWHSAGAVDVIRFQREVS